MNMTLFPRNILPVCVYTDVTHSGLRHIVTMGTSNALTKALSHLVGH